MRLKKLSELWGTKEKWGEWKERREGKLWSACRVSKLSKFNQLKYTQLVCNYISQALGSEYFESYLVITDVGTYADSVNFYKI